MNTRDTEFLVKLRELLQEYDVEISAHESGSYYQYVDSIAIWSDAKWDKNGNKTRDMIDIFIDGSTINAEAIKHHMNKQYGEVK